LYTLIFFSKGSLPWEGIKANTIAEKETKIMEKKMSMPPEIICKDLPGISLIAQKIHPYY